MAYISQIVVDGVAYDVQAKALDSTLDATILKKTNLVNGFTQTTAGVNALDAAAGKTLNDTKATKSAPTLYFKIGTQDGDPQSSYPHVEFRSTGNSSNGRSLSLSYYTASDTSTTNYLIDKNGVFLPSIQNRFNGLSTFAFDVNGGANKALTVDNEARFAILFSGRYASHQGFVVFGCSSSGAIAHTDVALPSSISFTTATNKLTITNGHGSLTARCLVIMMTDTASVHG